MHECLEMKQYQSKFGKDPLTGVRPTSVLSFFGVNFEGSWNKKLPMDLFHI